MKRVIVGILSIVLGFVSIASAQHVGGTSGGGSPTTTGWKGAYVGVSGGVALQSGSASTTTVFSPTGYFATTSVPAIADAGAQRVTPTGALAGGVIGYNLIHTGPLVIGVEADFGLMKASNSATSTATYPCCAPTAFTITQSLKTNWLFTVRPRVGVTLGSTLVYATGGLALTHVSYGAVFTDTFATATESGGVAETRTGWAIGGGFERPLTGRFTIQAHFLHATFGTLSAQSANFQAFTPPISFPTNTFTHSTTFRVRMVRVGLNYRF